MPQRIPVNTAPVFSSLRPRIYQQLLCLATKVTWTDSSLPLLFEEGLHFVEEAVAVLFHRHAALFCKFLEQFFLASREFGGDLNLDDK